MHPTDVSSGLTAERLREILHYDPETGLFTWLQSLRRGYVGKTAGKTGGDYVRIGIGKRFYAAHRLAWLYMMGEWPAVVVDHIDGDMHNNRWANIRACTVAQNTFNRRALRFGTSKYKGVSLSNGKWYASIKINGKSKALGFHPTEEEAHAAYAMAARELFKEFARVA